jgi:uncharacterized membrane protein YphA (DoxX/SURF4 family)
VNFLKNKPQMFLVLEWVGAVLLCLVFLVASIHKVTDPDGFSKIIASYNVMPSVLVGWVALFLPWLEINIALAILIPRARTAALVMGAGLLIVFAVLTGWNLLEGIEVPCGCFSNEAGPATWWSVARNMMLASIAMLAIYGRTWRITQKSIL